HGLDSDGQVYAPRHDDAGAIRPRFGEGQISRLDYEISLRADDRAGSRAAGDRRAAVAAVGNLSAHGDGTALYVAGEFGDALVGNAALQDARPFDKQLVGGAALVGRRLAQQSSRASGVGAARASVVRS